MNKTKICLYCVIWLLFFYFVCIYSGKGVSHAARLENKRWSFHFKNYTISDALEKMTRVTSIDIFTNKNRDKSLFNKSYKDQTIDQILKDLFRKKNSAMVWSYGDNGLEAIGVWIFEGSGSGGSFGPRKFTKKTGRNLRSNRIKKDVDHKPRVVRRQSQKTKENKSFPPPNKSGDYIKQAKESIGYQYSKMTTAASQSKAHPSEHGIPSAGESEVTSSWLSALPDIVDSGANKPDDEIPQEEDQTAETVPPSPAPEGWHGLEAPPMPPGFSYKK